MPQALLICIFLKKLYFYKTRFGKCQVDKSGKMCHISCWLKIISMFLGKILDIIMASPLSSPPLWDPLSLVQPPAPSSVVLLLKNVAIKMQTRTFSLHPPLQKIGSHLDALQQQWSQLCSPGRVQGYKSKMIWSITYRCIFELGNTKYTSWLPKKTRIPYKM